MCIRDRLDGAPLCEVTENGGIAYRNKDIDEPERIAAKDKVYELSLIHICPSWITLWSTARRAFP